MAIHAKWFGFLLFNGFITISLQLVTLNLTLYLLLSSNLFISFFSLGPDYMTLSRAGPVSRDDVGLPGSRHVC